MEFNNLLNDVLPIIEKSAPLLAHAIAGPFAGVAMSFISDIFGVNSDDPQALVKAISTDSESTTKLSQASTNFSSSLIKMVSQFKYPNSAEVSLKLNWDKNSD